MPRRRGGRWPQTVTPSAEWWPRPSPTTLWRRGRCRCCCRCATGAENHCCLSCPLLTPLLAGSRSCCNPTASKRPPPHRRGSWWCAAAVAASPWPSTRAAGSGTAWRLWWTRTRVGVAGVTVLRECSGTCLAGQLGAWGEDAVPTWSFCASWTWLSMFGAPHRPACRSVCAAGHQAQGGLAADADRSAPMPCRVGRGCLQRLPAPTPVPAVLAA